MAICSFVCLNHCIKSWEDNMKKFSLLCITALTCMSLAACGSYSSHKSSASSHSSSKVVKKHHKKQNKKKQSSSSSTSSNTNSNQNAQQTQQSNSSNGRPLTQGEINRQRGYDPNGNPLLPGQDHAAGSNPDGTPDAWVQGQIDWAKRNGYLNPDGSETDKGRAADEWVEENAH